MAKNSGDLFLDFLDDYQKQTEKDEAVNIGKIINEVPLQVRIDGLVLDESDLMINPYLREYTEQVNAITTEVSEHSHTVVNITHLSKLKINKKVFCYGFEYDESSKTYQKYYVLEVMS